MTIEIAIFHSYVSHYQRVTTRMSSSPILSQTIRRRYSGYVDAVIQRWALVMDEYLRRRQESEARLVGDILYTNKYIIVS